MRFFNAIYNAYILLMIILKSANGILVQRAFFMMEHFFTTATFDFQAVLGAKTFFSHSIFFILAALALEILTKN